MKDTEPIYITGHQHPDTDSVASAIAYAFFKRAKGIKAIPCRLGPLNNETNYLLKRFGFEAPLLLDDARKQIREIEIDPPDFITPETTVFETLQLMNSRISTVRFPSSPSPRTVLPTMMSRIASSSSAMIRILSLI